jgi:hypothetical protein
VVERGSAWLNALYPVAAGHVLYTVRITGAEIIAAIFLRARTGSLTATAAQTAARQFKAEFGSRYQLTEVTEALVDAAMTLAERHGLRLKG